MAVAEKERFSVSIQIQNLCSYSLYHADNSRKMEKIERVSNEKKERKQNKKFKQKHIENSVIVGQSYTKSLGVLCGNYI